MGPQKPKILIHIGRPDQEEPHKSMERCEKFYKENPNMKLLVIVWDQKDYDEFLPKMNKEKGEVFLWKDDNELMSYLTDIVPVLLGAPIVMPRWYICKKKHITAGTYKEQITECETCKGYVPGWAEKLYRKVFKLKPRDVSVEVITPHKEKFEQFAAVFSTVIKLVNFDTSSGDFLFSVVNPAGNVLRNMPAAVGCQHQPAIQAKDLMGSGKGKTALIVGAGPSLEDALPELKRLSHTGKYITIVVGRAFKKVHDAGVKIDYAHSVEMFDWDCAIFEGLTKDYVGDTVLSFASVCAPKAVEMWPGNRVCVWDMETAQILNRPDWIYGGNSITHHMLNFAVQILGCEPCILVGVDLAYTKPRTHAEGTSPNTWPDEIKKAEEKYHEAELWVPCTGKGSNFDPLCHRTPVALGGGIAFSKRIEVRSSHSYKQFATLFSILAAKHGKKILNACPNGQKIDGIDYVDLKELT